ASLDLGTGANISPSAAPTDNGLIVSMTVTSSPGFTGTLNVNKTTGQVTVANAGPAGTHTVTVTATDDCGAVATRTFMLTVNSAPNPPPTISPRQPLSRQQGSQGMPSMVAEVNDRETPAGSLTVTANTPSGITVNGFINTNGLVAATVTADCSATVGTNIGQLTVTHGGGLSSVANLTINVTANASPSLSYAEQQTVNVGGSLTINPATAPSDNGSIPSINLQRVVQPSTGNRGVIPGGVVSITNAAPLGNYTVTIRAPDTCGASTDEKFTLNVGCPAIRINPEMLPGGAPGAAY